MTRQSKEIGRLEKVKRLEEVKELKKAGRIGKLELPIKRSLRNYF